MARPAPRTAPTPLRRPGALAWCAAAAVACSSAATERLPRAEAPAPGAAAPGAAAPGAASLHYRVGVDVALSTLDVTVCFTAAPPRRLAVREDAAAAITRVESRVAGRPDRRLAIEEGHLDLGGLHRGDCVAYSVDLGRAATGPVWRGAHFGDAVLLGSTSWLLRPRPRTATLTATLELALPAGFEAAVGWPLVDGRHVLDVTAFDLFSHMVIGRLHRRVIEVDGGILELVRLRGALAVDDDDLARWLADTARAVATVHGRFPVERAVVAIVPHRPGRDPVAFGHVGRGGGATVVLLVREDATIEALRDDWVAPHELAHLAVPPVRRDDAWLSEGLATYYQEVALARGGARSPLDAWRALDDGFTRGRRAGTGRTLGDESRAMYRTHAFVRVYWAGAALALRADVELRAHGSSLDAALAAVARDAGQRRRAWRGEELWAEIDRLTGVPVGADIIAPALASPEFPDLSATYEVLGLRRGADGLLELSDAPGAALRDAIMR